MKQGGGKGKGGEFERRICVELSKWITKGEKIDCLWRSAMSGGRATVKRGQVRQAGDITAVAPEGHALTEKFYVECKAYKTLTLDCLVTGKGTLIDFWKIAVREAKSHNKLPMLIFKRNHWPIVVILDNAGRVELGIAPAESFVRSGNMVFIFFDVMTAREFKL
jgi:hypothetical protein